MISALTMWRQFQVVVEARGVFFPDFPYFFHNRIEHG